MVRTRFAPSPTGHMHLGNVWVAFLNWLWTRQQKGTIVLRIEDIDRERCRPVYTKDLMDDLSWLGLSWDEGPGWTYSYGETVQSGRLPLYETLRKEWERDGRIYPCYCTRARLRKIASAPHEGEEAPLYDGRCRNLSAEERGKETKPPSWRVRMEDTSVTVDDMIRGRLTKELRAGRDDFVIVRADGMIAYQLAASFDDGAMGITHVFRGNDLLPSAFDQAWLLKTMGKTVPVYCHLPLLVDRDGVRLSKRQKGITVRELREEGMSAEDIIGRLLYYAGALSRPERMSAEKAEGEIPFASCVNLAKHTITVE